jgi:hypothetical protein
MRALVHAHTHTHTHTHYIYIYIRARARILLNIGTVMCVLNILSSVP